MVSPPIAFGAVDCPQDHHPSNAVAIASVNSCNRIEPPNWWVARERLIATPGSGGGALGPGPLSLHSEMSSTSLAGDVGLRDATITRRFWQDGESGVERDEAPSQPWTPSAPRVPGYRPRAAAKASGSGPQTSRTTTRTGPQT